MDICEKFGRNVYKYRTERNLSQEELAELADLHRTYISYITPILKRYYEAFKAKTYSAENNDTDVLMDIFGITPEQKRENRQYWGRELGMMWQLIVTEICKHHSSSFKPALKIGDSAR